MIYNGKAITWVVSGESMYRARVNNRVELFTSDKDNSLVVVVDKTKRVKTDDVLEFDKLCSFIIELVDTICEE
jgi:hypothetical protein